MASLPTRCTATSPGSAIPCLRARVTPASLKGANHSLQQGRHGRWFPFADASSVRPRLAPCLCAAEEASSVASSRWRVKKVESDEELLMFLQIALQGYFESSFGGMFQGDHSRYVNSFMRQKLEQEMDRLKEKYQARGDKMPETLCLVHISSSDIPIVERHLQIALGRESDDVVAGLEICVSERLSGICPMGVPAADKDGFYIQNVIVQPEMRRQVSSAAANVRMSGVAQGIGDSLMRALIEMLQELKATGIYAHVEAQNEEALAFYDKHNFQIIKEVKELDPQANLGISLNCAFLVIMGCVLGRLLLVKLDISQQA